MDYLNPHEYCMSEVTVTFQSSTSSADPQVTLEGRYAPLAPFPDPPTRRFCTSHVENRHIDRAHSSLMMSRHARPMTITLSLKQKIVGVVVAGAVVLGTGGAVAWAQTGGGAPPSTAAPSQSADVPAKALRPLARRAVHGDVVVKAKDGSYVTVTFDRGTVTAASDTSVTLQRPDTNQPVTFTVDANTKVHGVASAGALQTGKDAVVISKAGTATQILQRA